LASSPISVSEAESSPLSACLGFVQKATNWH